MVVSELYSCICDAVPVKYVKMKGLRRAGHKYPIPYIGLY